MKSKCCKAEMEVASADEGTNFYVCSACSKACDADFYPWEDVSIAAHAKDIYETKSETLIMLDKLVETYRHDPHEQEIIKWCEALQTKLLEKYRKGKAEHGDDTSKIDYNHEIGLEILDIISYHCMFKAK